MRLDRRRLAIGFGIGSSSLCDWLAIALRLARRGLAIGLVSLCDWLGVPVRLAHRGFVIGSSLLCDWLATHCHLVTIALLSA
jgi:hypothetical protein